MYTLSAKNARIYHPLVFGPREAVRLQTGTFGEAKSCVDFTFKKTRYTVKTLNPLGRGVLLHTTG